MYYDGMTITQQPAALITIDPHNGRQVIWNVERVSPIFPTHKAADLPQYLIVTRQGGRSASYIVWVELDPGTGQVIRNGKVNPVGRR